MKAFCAGPGPTSALQIAVVTVTIIRIILPLVNSAFYKTTACSSHCYSMPVCPVPGVSLQSLASLAYSYSTYKTFPEASCEDVPEPFRQR